MLVNLKDRFEKLIMWLIVLTLIINAALIICPFLIDSDPTVYFIIAKHMVLNGHWQNLTTNYGPWLDKPHFPFWVTALSFKLFGCHVWSYILPGFLFYLLGGIYTYRLAQLLYQDRIIALLSLLVYVTTLRLMLPSLDIRAEAYLLGEIMPACYYWLKYDVETHWRYLVLGALFTSFAVMTKGIFVLVTIGSGVFLLSIYQKRLRQLFSMKWLVALLLVCLCATPEYIALYLQFGGKGLRWFFLESQFGRFFETGRIIKHHGNVLFFTQTFFWAFLPWPFVFIAAITKVFQNKRAFVYLISSFFVTFLMFSLTPFKMDYYTNIIFPFAAILSAQYLYYKMQENPDAFIFKIQICAAVLFTLCIMMLVSMVAIKKMPEFMWLNLVPIVSLLFMWLNPLRFTCAEKGIFYPVVSISLGFLILVLIQAVIVATFSPGYMIARYINQQHTDQSVYEYQQMTNLSVYLDHDNAHNVNDLKQLPVAGSYYLVMDAVGPVADVLTEWPHSYIVLKQESLKLSRFIRQVFLNGPSKRAEYQVLIYVEK